MWSKQRHLFLGLLLLVISVSLYVVTSSPALMFDDAAEFALVIRLGSIAHPPGFPAYIFTGMLWDRLLSPVFTEAIPRLNLFSALLTGLGCVFLFGAFRRISKVLMAEDSGAKADWIAFFPALIFALGNTTWLWANTIEVYSFQVFAMGLLLYGLTSYQYTASRKFAVIAALGLALGWSNHHLTMILFTPFTPFFFLPGLFVPIPLSGKNKKSSVTTSWISDYFNVLRTRDFLLFTAISASITILFYLGLMIRASHDFPFMFGKPENLDLLFYHIRGGAYTKNITDTSDQIMSARVPYFFELTGKQFGVFLVLVLAGIIEMIRRRSFQLLTVILSYFTIQLMYQLKNNQWASTDAYMLLAFMTLTIPIVYALSRWFSSWKLAFVMPLLLSVQLVMAYPSHDRKSYPVSTGLMTLLDESAPKNSIVLISDWTTIIQYNYFRICEGFRTDLRILNYDYKFNHYRLLEINYPELYQKIKPEYDDYIAELGKEHPYQIYNTGCDLTTDSLNVKFKRLTKRLEAVAREENVPFLTDPKANYFFSSTNVYDPNRYISGCFSSSMPVDSTFNAPFVRLDLAFLDSKLLRDDPSCLDKLVDFQAMFDQHINFYSANGDTLNALRAQDGKARVMKIQRELKQSMSFAFKVK